MSKRKIFEPPTLKQDGNYAVVYLNGEKIRLGRYGTDEAQQEYHRILAEWLAIGDATGSPKTKKSYSINDLAAEFLEWAKKSYGQSDYGNFRTAIQTTLDIYPKMSVKDFGPRALKTVQKQLVEKGYARSQCNKLTSFVRRIFVWGIEREFVPPEVAGALKYVTSVRESEAHDRPAREDVPDEVVKRTLP